MAQTLADLSNWLESLPTKMEPTTQELKTAADNQAKRIKDRTRSGVSVEGGVFQPDKDGSTPLIKSGAMLENITSEAQNTEAKIYFPDPLQKVKATVNNQKRHFFGVSLQDKTDIISELQGSVTKRIVHG